VSKPGGPSERLSPVELDAYTELRSILGFGPYELGPYEQERMKKVLGTFRAYARSRVKEELDGLKATYRSLAYSSAPMHSVRDALQWATKVIDERLAAIEKEAG